jgi:hypothetical protein
MSDRLQELLRQKALLDEHAAWLTREIAQEQARSGARPAPAVPPAATAPAPAPGPAVAVAPASAVPAALEAEADAIIDQYRESDKTVQQNVKRGCILYFVAALALLALGVVAIYFMAHRK